MVVDTNGAVQLARVLFDDMFTRDLASWNSIIDDYMMVGDLNVAHQLSDQMPQRNLLFFFFLLALIGTSALLYLVLRSLVSYWISISLFSLLPLAVSHHVLLLHFYFLFNFLDIIMKTLDVIFTFYI